MSRFALAPQWLPYLPPTMAPVSTSQRDGWLERPEEAFGYYFALGVSDVVVEEKHMGSRAVMVIARDLAAARRRFCAAATLPGAIYTRTGRAFFDTMDWTEAVLTGVIHALEGAGVWDELATDWLVLEGELMPWSARAQSRISTQFAPNATAALQGLGRAAEALATAAARELDVAAGRQDVGERLGNAQAYAQSEAPSVWPAPGPHTVRFAPFHLLAGEGSVYLERDHLWQMAMAERLAAAGAGTGLVQATRWRRVDLTDESAVAAAVLWWEEMIQAGGEGMVVKPTASIVRSPKGLVQPAVKVRGRDYLRLIYGPDYDRPHNLSRLRKRGVSAKRALALREFALGHEALSRLINGDDLARVHEAVFGVLALESEPVDPRL